MTWQPKSAGFLPAISSLFWQPRSYGPSCLRNIPRQLGFVGCVAQPLYFRRDSLLFNRSVTHLSSPSNTTHSCEGLKPFNPESFRWRSKTQQHSNFFMTHTHHSFLLDHTCFEHKLTRMNSCECTLLKNMTWCLFTCCGHHDMRLSIADVCGTWPGLPHAFKTSPWQNAFALVQNLHLTTFAKPYVSARTALEYRKREKRTS
jgi:hypothetical protein